MIRSYCELFCFPKEATEALCAAYNQLLHRANVTERFAAIREELLRGDGKSFLTSLQGLAEETDIDRRVMDMLFLLYAAPALREEYQKRGIDDAIFVDTLMDLRYKLMECHRAFGVWGIFVTFWYPGFYHCERFALGRLQYEKRPFKYADYRGILKEGDTVLNCHIPSSGPLTPESVIDSLKRAYAFYGDVRRGGILPVVCSSWMLYPPHSSLFGEGTNMKAFYEMFRVLHSHADPSNADYWRVFDRPFSTEELSSAPEDTGLRRRLKRFLLEGNTMGSGYGVILFDGERILS